jgi:hypothetical protein
MVCFLKDSLGETTSDKLVEWKEAIFEKLIQANGLVSSAPST